VREAEGVADGDDPVAHVDGLSESPSGSGVKVLGVDAEDADVGELVEADDLRREAPLVGELTSISSRPLDDVVVREDDAVLVDDEARAQALRASA
jgi:hypothetical protein